MQPNSVEDLAEFVRGAGAQKLTVHSRSGGLPDAVAVDLSKLDKVIDYPAADMTITVQSGVTIAQLQLTLAENNQHLPIDIPNPATTTVGDAVAQNLSGSRRSGYGTLRDYVIGVSAIDGLGRCFKSGGQVVKNVAGYDLCKLLTGSHGTLGILTQLTLKVRPKPQAIALSRLTVRSLDDAERTLESLGSSATRPIAIDLLLATGCDLVVVFDGDEKSVRWQQDQFQGEVNADVLTVSDEEAESYLQQTARTWLPMPNRFVVGVLPSMVTRFLKQAGCGQAVSHAANGIVLGESDSLHSVQSMAEGLGGWFLSLAPDANPFAAGPMTATMRKVKRAFDPHGILNPHIDVGFEQGVGA